MQCSGATQCYRWVKAILPFFPLFSITTVIIIGVFYFTEKAMAPHSSTFAWKIPWTEEFGRLQSMGSLESDMTERLHFHFSLSCIGEGNDNPLQCSCLENPRDGGAWWAAVCGVAQSQTWLKRISSNSNMQLKRQKCVLYVYSYTRHIWENLKLSRSEELVFYSLGISPKCSLIVLLSMLLRAYWLRISLFFLCSLQILYGYLRNPWI